MVYDPFFFENPSLNTNNRTLKILDVTIVKKIGKRIFSDFINELEDSIRKEAIKKVIEEEGLEQIKKPQ